MLFRSPPTLLNGNPVNKVGGHTNFTVVVYITYVEDLGSAQYDITYNGSYINITGVTSGVVQEGSTFYEMPVINWGLIPPATQGRVRIINNIPGGGVNGSGYLAKLHFYVDTSRCLSSDISFATNGTLDLFDSGWNPIPGVTCCDSWTWAWTASSRTARTSSSHFSAGRN